MILFDLLLVGLFRQVCWVWLLFGCFVASEFVGLIVCVIAVGCVIALLRWIWVVDSVDSFGSLIVLIFVLVV